MRTAPTSTMSGEDTTVEPGSKPDAPSQGLPPGARELLEEYVGVIEEILDRGKEENEEDLSPEFGRLAEIEGELKEDYGIEFEDED